MRFDAFPPTVVAVAFALAVQAQSPIPLPPNVDDSTFGPLLTGNTYVANQSVSVSSTRTLTVQPGVVVKFAAGTSFQIAGTLDVNGSATMPVFFTSTRDGTVGLAIDPLAPAPGDWGRLQFISSNTSQVRGLEVRFSGSNGDGAVQTLQSNVLLDGVVVTDSASAGINLLGAMPTIIGCRVQNCAGRAFERATLQGLPMLGNNVASGNALDVIRVTSGTILGTQFIGPTNLVDSTIVIANNVTVPTGRQLTIAAGVVVKYETDDRFIVNGTLLCDGTSQAPVVFTSLADDAIGGDTGKDGPSVGAPGDWDGLTFGASSDASVLRSTRVRFAGNGTPGAISLLQSNITLAAVHVERSASDGLDVQGTMPTVQNCRFDDNLGRSIDRVSMLGLPNFVANTGTGNLLGDAIRVTNGIVSANLTVTTNNLIEDTLVMDPVLQINVGRTFTVGPGVIFKWATATRRVSVTGALVCNGTANAPVVFTSLADDAIGGDTGRDGPTVGTPGDWPGLSFGGTADASELRFTSVRFGGNNLAGAVELLNGADILLVDTAIERSATLGLRLTSSRPIVRRCRFDGNLGRAVDGFAWTQMTRFSDCTATGNVLGDYTRLVNGATGASGTSTRVDVWNTLNGDGVIVADVRTVMNSNTSLQLGAGLIVKFTAASASSSGFTAGGPGTSLFFDGRGYAPIVLTSFLDDDHGGDTNGDGNASAPGPGSWGRVEYGFSTAPAQMNHVLARFGGIGAATVTLDTANVSIDAVRVELSASDGINIAQNGGGCRNLVAFGNSGDGIVLSATAVSLIHATVAANQGRGVVSEGTHSGAASASISWFNGVNPNDNFVGFVDGLGLPARIFSSNGSPAHAGTQNNFVADPLFTDPNNGDLSLSLFSPCVGNAGAPNDAFTYEDHDGRSRVLDHNLFGFALPDIGAYEYAVYDATIAGVPRLGSSVAIVVDGQPFQGNPPGAGILFFGGPFLGVGQFLPPYGNANIQQPGFPFFSVTWAFNGTPFHVDFPNDQTFLGLPLGLQVLTVQLSNVGTGNWTQAFHGTLAQ